MESRFMKTVGLLFVLVWVMSQAVAGQQEPEGDAVTVIRALEHEWVEGQSRNDIRALDLIFDNALVYVEYGKLVTKGEYLSRIKRAGPEVSGIEMGPITIRRFGNTAVVVGIYGERERSNGQFRVEAVAVHRYLGVQAEWVGARCRCGRAVVEVNVEFAERRLAPHLGRP